MPDRWRGPNRWPEAPPTSWATTLAVMFSVLVLVSVAAVAAAFH